MISKRSTANLTLSLLTVWGMCLTTGAQEQTSVGGQPTPYSKKELSRMFEKARDDVRLAPNADDGAVSSTDENADVVELDPVEVKSDDVEIIRKIDRSMKPKSSNPVTAEMLRIFTEQNRKLLQDAQYDARASGRFFNEKEQRIGPADVPGTGKMVIWQIPNPAKNADKKVTKVAAEDQQPGNP